MALTSGIVLDFNSNAVVPNVTVCLTTVTGTIVEASGVTNLAGVYSFNRPDTINSNVIYFVSASGYNSYSRTISKDILYQTLYVKADSFGAPNASGIAYSNMVSTSLVTSTNVRDMIATPCHLYIITDGGLDIVDSNTKLSAGYITVSGGFTAISLDPDICSRSGVLLGTANSGVLQFKIPDVFPATSTNLAALLVSKYNVSQGLLQSNKVNKIHQNKKHDLVIATASGIDVITSSGVHYYTIYPSGVENTAVQISEYGDIYYSPTNSGLYMKTSPSGNWTNPDYTVVISGTGANPFPLLSNYINDIAVTSVSGVLLNTIFLATASGLVSYQEDANLNVSASGARLVRSIP